MSETPPRPDAPKPVPPRPLQRPPPRRRVISRLPPPGERRRPPTVSTANSPWRNPVFRLILLGLGLALVVALLADLRGAMRRTSLERERIEALERPESLMLGLSDQRYVDPEGRFALTLPAAWLVREGAAADPYTVGFRGPRDIDIAILVSDLPHDRFDLLLGQIRGKEQQLDIRMNIREIEFQGRRAAERQSRLNFSSLYMLDFMDGHRAYHLVASIPREHYENLLPVVKEVIATLEVPAGRRWPAPPGGGAPQEDQSTHETPTNR